MFDPAAVNNLLDLKFINKKSEKLKSTQHLRYIPGRGGAESPREKSDQVLDGDLVSAVVDLHVVPVRLYVNVLVSAIEDGGGPGVARVARQVVSNHQDDLQNRE